MASLARSALTRRGVMQLKYHGLASSTVACRATSANIASRSHPSGTALPYALRALSSLQKEESKGLFDKLKDKMDDRTTQNQKEKEAELFQTIANTEVWDMNAFSAQIDASMPGWRQYLPGMSKMKQVKEVKEAQRIISAIKNEIGGDTTPETLEKLKRKEKLKLSLKTGIDVEDLNSLLQQFKGMEMMHRILRYRKSNGMPIPKDQEGMKVVVQNDQLKVMTQKEKRNMQMTQAKGAMRAMRSGH